MHSASLAASSQRDHHVVPDAASVPPFSMSGLIHSRLPPYDASRDPHLPAKFRSRRSNVAARSLHANDSDRALPPLGVAATNSNRGGNNRNNNHSRPVSVLGLCRLQRQARQHDVLAHNARARRDMWHRVDAAVDGDERSSSGSGGEQRRCDSAVPNLSESRGGGGGKKNSVPADIGGTHRSGSHHHHHSSLLRTNTDLTAAMLPAEHQGKLRILERMFELFEAGQCIEAKRMEDEHHRVCEKQMVAKKMFEEESAALRLQFVCRRERKQMRELYPKLRRASTLSSFQEQ